MSLNFQPPQSKMVPVTKQIFRLACPTNSDFSSKSFATWCSQTIFQQETPNKMGLRSFLSPRLTFVFFSFFNWRGQDSAQALQRELAFADPFAYDDAVKGSVGYGKDLFWHRIFVVLGWIKRFTRRGEKRRNLYFFGCPEDHFAHHFTKLTLKNLVTGKAFADSSVFWICININ